MHKTLTGIAAAAMLTAAAMSAPANAAPIRHASGLTEQQSTVEPVQYRRYGHYRYGPRWRGYYGPRRYYRGYRYGYDRPYAYGPYPYYYRPRPFVGFGIGPFGFGVW